MQSHDELSAEGIALYAYRMNIHVTAEVAYAIAAVCRQLEGGEFEYPRSGVGE
ncbi:hypothetical protein CCICO_04295 [Corynebacterium ciconiae DSM 44920]|nr:hypothetical protein CCICO_04295 [Corynebacterium ciconiae DSM 44920]